MKFIAVVIVIAAVLTAVALAVPPTRPQKCDYKCTKLDETICASNGICINNFPSKCQLEKYNCLYPQKSFQQEDDWKCSVKSLPLCSLGDL